MPISHSMSFIPIFLIEYHVCDSQFVRHWRLKDEQVRDSFCAFGSCSLTNWLSQTWYSIRNIGMNDIEWDIGIC